MSQAILGSGDYWNAYTKEEHNRYFAPNPFFDSSVNLTSGFGFARGNVLRPGTAMIGGTVPVYRSLQDAMRLLWTPRAWAFECATAYGGPYSVTTKCTPRTIGGGGFYTYLTPPDTSIYNPQNYGIPICETPTSPHTSRYDWFFYFWLAVPSLVPGSSVTLYSRTRADGVTPSIGGELRVTCGDLHFTEPLWLEQDPSYGPETYAIVTLTASF